MQKENTGNGMLLGTIVGGAIGAAAALLFAPKSGAKLRQEISEGFHAFCDKTKDIASTVSESTKELVANVKEEAIDLAQHAKESNETIKDSLITTKDELKDKMSGSMNDPKM